MNFKNTLFKYYNFWFPVLAVVLIFGSIEILVRMSGLADQLETNFKFYVRNVASNLESPYYIEDPLLMWSLKPNYKGTFLKYLKINSQGYRDRLYKIEKDSNTFRILALGDSSTFGHRMPNSEIYHSLLEEKLNKEYGGKINFEVINAGAEGYTSYQGLNIYKYKFAEYKPDIVTAYFGLSDTKKAYRLSDREIMGDGIFRKIVNGYLLNLATYRLITDWKSKLLNSKPLQSDNDKSEGNVPRVSPDDYRKNIAQLNEIVKKNGASLVLISPAVGGDPKNLIAKNIKHKKYIEDIVAYRGVLEDVAKKHHIPLLTVGELTEKMWRNPDDEKYVDYFFDVVHPNYLGHELLMERLHDFLLGLKLLPSAK